MCKNLNSKSRKNFLKNLFFSCINLLIFSPVFALNADLFLNKKNNNVNEENPKIFLMSLERGISLALTAERRLGSVQGAVQQSEINIEIAASEFDWKIFPKGDGGVVGGGKAGTGLTLGLGVEVNKKFTPGTRVSFTPSIMKAAKNFQTNLQTSITQPLLRGLGSDYTLGPLRAAQYSNRSALRMLYQTQVNLIFQTIKGLYEILKQDTLVELDKESFTHMKKFLLSTKIKEKIGMSDALDIYRAESEFKQTEDSLNHSMERLQDAKDNLREILALPHDMPIEVDIAVEYSPIIVNESEAISTALKNRIELEQAKDQLQESQRLEHLSQLNLRPELNLVVDYTSFSRDEAFTRSWTNKRESKWGIGFISTGDPRNIRESAALTFSQFATDDSARNIEQVRDNIILEVKRVLRDLQRTLEKINLNEDQIENSRKGFYLARLKFEYGLANNFDLLQAEKSLRLAQASLINAVIEHRIAEFRFLSVLGILLEKPEVCR